MKAIMIMISALILSGCATSLAYKTAYNDTYSTQSAMVNGAHPKGSSALWPSARPAYQCGGEWSTAKDAKTGKDVEIFEYGCVK